mgnify:CR=1 FL=1
MSFVSISLLDLSTVLRKARILSIERQTGIMLKVGENCPHNCFLVERSMEEGFTSEYKLISVSGGEVTAMLSGMIHSVEPETRLTELEQDGVGYIKSEELAISADGMRFVTVEDSFVKNIMSNGVSLDDPSPYMRQLFYDAFTHDFAVICPGSVFKNVDKVVKGIVWDLEFEYGW